MKLERLISIIYMLLNNEVVSASELADKYQVSQRTIYRDIEAICAAGIPVVSYQGVNGGYGIMDEYKMDKSLLGSYDVGSLITVLHSMSTVFKDERAMETIHRLQTIENEPKTPSMTMDLGSWRSYNEFLRTLRTAINARRVVRFEYINAKNEKADRIVEPVSLNYKYDTWYLYGFCRGRNDYRAFKLSRMVDLAALPEFYQGNHDLASRNNPAHKYKQEQPHANVVLRFSVDSLARALDYFHSVEKSFNEDGSLTVALKLYNPSRDGWLTSMILSFGDDVEIVEPPELRQKVKDKIEKMLHRYS